MATNCSSPSERDPVDARIPEQLAISVAAWLALLVVFLIIRYSASDFSRVALATSHQWMTVLYSRKQATLKQQQQEREREKRGAEEKDEEKEKLVDGEEDSRSKSFSTLLYEDKHWYTWIINFFWRLRDSDIRDRCGPDASLYLSLERYLIVLLLVLSVLSLAIILPVNYSANSLQCGAFAKTTISNIDPSSPVLWLHTVFTLLYLAIAGAFMIHFSMQLGKSQLEHSNHTVMVEWIPTYVHREDILNHLQEALPDSCVADVQLAYDVSKLTKLSNQLHGAAEKLECADSVINEKKARRSVTVGLKRMDAKSYYEQQCSELKMAVEKEKHTVRNEKRLGIGFFTFARSTDAQSFHSSYKLCRSKPHSSMYSDVSAGRWWVSMAPFPTDIQWENLSVPYLMWWLRWLLINLVLFVFLFFFTTPPILVASINNIKFIKDIEGKIFNSIQNTTNGAVSPDLAQSLFSNLLTLLFASLLPLLVSSSSYLEAHWTKSFREQTIMRKTYFFLLLMLITLPSIGLTSLEALAELTFNTTNGTSIGAIENQLKYVYLPSNGALFIGYVTVVAFISSPLELIRVPELMIYFYNRLTAVTRLEREKALSKAGQYDFRYGVQYAWILIVFNMVMTFSLTTPLILPFGVVYFILKYCVDRYNIYYAYKPSAFNGRQFLHTSAVNFVIVGAVHLQLSMLFFSVVRLGRVDPRSIIMMITFILTCIFCIGVFFFGWFQHLLPSLRTRLGKDYRVFGTMRVGITSVPREEDMTEESESGEIIAKGSYIPPVLRDSAPDPLSDNSAAGYGYQSFGSTDRMGRRSPGHMGTADPTKGMSTLERSTSKAKTMKNDSAKFKSEAMVKSSDVLR